MSKRIQKPAIAGAKVEYTQLRAAAEKFLDGNSLINSSEYNKEIKDLFQELQVHQIELEMQNDELKITNVELERQKGKFSGMYNLAPVGYFVLDHTGVIKDVNDTGTSMLETGKENIVGMRLRTFITSDSSDTYYRFFMQMLKGSRVQRCNLDIKALNETIVHAQLGGFARNMGDGPIECYIAIVDISERIKAEQEMAEIKDRLELSLKASLAGTWELDVETMNFFLDEGSQRICNVPLTGFAGNFQDFLLLIHQEDRKQVELAFRHSLKDHKEIDLTCRIGNSDDQECYTVIRGHLISPAGSRERYAGIILDITEKTQMEKYSDQLREEYQKKIASAMITTEENERKRISESLHDSVSQLLYGIQIQLGQLEKTVPDSSNIKSVKKLLDQAIDETRNISFELAPAILTDFGLSTTIEELVKRLSSQDLKMKVNIRGLFKRLDLLLETNIYRIVQELVNNSMKHSGAGQISIDITKDKVIEIIVKDNGKGYSVLDQENYTSGSGLSSIRNRLRIYNGSMAIDSALGRGTTVHVKLLESIPEQG
jgi:PAS domain S-box-containing protein